MNKINKLIVCFALLLIAGCQNQNHSTAEQNAKPTAFQLLADSIKILDAPFYITEVDLQYLKHSSYLMLDSSKCNLLLSTADPDAQYFSVGRLNIDSTFYTIILLKSKVDSVFNASEQFYLNNYAFDGSMLGSVELSASINGNDHFIITGIANEDGLISTEKYHFVFENGQWDKNPEPVKIIQYNIDSTGNIRQSNVFINLDNGNDSTASAI